MAKHGRGWFPLDNNFTRDPRIVEAGWAAAELYLAACGYLSATGSEDGRITRGVVAKLGVAKWESLADRLVKVAAWTEPDPDTYVVVAWNGWHREADSTRRTREWRERQRSQRDVT